MARLPGAGGGIMHACLRINGSTVMLSDEFPEYGMAGPTTLGGSPVTIHLMVPDVDAAFARAVEAGATATMPVADQFWGDRYGALRDPFGHSWSSRPTCATCRRTRLRRRWPARRPAGRGRRLQ